MTVARTLSESSRAKTKLREAHTQWVIVGAGVAGVAAYAFQLLGTRALGSEGYAPIGVLWTLQYLVLSIGLFAVETYVARQTALTRAPRLTALWAYTIALVVVVGIPVLVLRQRLFASSALAFPLALAATALAYGGFVIVRGRLAGGLCFREYALATSAESVVRVAVASALLAAATDARLLAWALPCGPASACLLWWAAKRASEDATSVPAAALVEEGAQDPLTVAAGSAAAGFLVPVVLANGISQVLLAAGPLLLVSLGGGAAAVSIFFVTTTTARIPLVFAFGGLLSRLTSTLARMVRDHRDRELRRVVTALVGLGGTAAAVCGAASAVVGPAVVAVMFGSEFRPEAWLVGGAAAGVVLAAVALALNQVLIALQAEWRLLLPWLLAMAAAVLVVKAGPSDPVLAVTVAFVAAEAVAVGALALTAAATSVPQAARSAKSPPREAL